MDNIVIDALTGDVVVKTMIKHIMPGMHDSSVLKAVHRALKDYAGPRMSSRLINGRNTSVANIELCYDILDKMTGHKWTMWRQQSGQAFKQALHERVQQARSAVQMHEPPPLQQQVATEVAQVETKASVLQKSLRSVNINGSVRIDEPCGEASAIDVIKMLCPGTNSNNAAFMLARVLKKDAEDKGPHDVVGDRCRSTPLAERVHYIKINGRGNVTPCCDAKTIVEIIWLLPARAAKEFRRQSAETICRVLGGDVTLCDEIEQRCARLQSTEEGRAYQNFVLDQGPAKKQRSEPPFWFEHASGEEKRAFVAVMAKKAMALEEMDMHDTCQHKLESLGHFAPRDKIEFADRIKDIQRRASRAIAAGPADNAAISRPVDDSIDPETGLLMATPKCSESVRGSETSICLEAGKMGIKVGEKAGQVGKVVKGLYSERYGDEAGRNIPKRNTTFRGKPFPENSYWERDSDLIQQAIQGVCVPAATPRQLITQTLLFATK